MTTLDAATVAALDEPRIYFDSEPTLRGFGVRVRRDHGGKLRRTWIMQYRHQTDDGVIQRRQKLGEYPRMTAERARTKAREWREKLDKGIDPAGEKAIERVAVARTFSKTVDEYLALKQAAVREETYRLSKLYLTGRAYFGKLHAKPLSKIMLADVSAALNAIRLKSGSPTAGQARKHLSALFVWSMRQGYAAANPVVSAEQIKAAPPRERVLDANELHKVWNACQDDDYGRIIKLLILTGCRATEVGGLRESEIVDDEIRLPGSRTKNHRAHTVPITDLMREIIDSIPRRHGRDFLFGQWADSGFTSWNQKPTLDGVLTEPWTVHDLRRTFRSGLGRLGIPPHVAELCLNHKKKGLLAIYDQYDYGAEIAAAFVRWDEHVRSVIEGTASKVVPIRRVEELRTPSEQKRA
jgi:integrase